MSISKLPSGQWRAQVWDPSKQRNVSVGSVLGGPASFPTKRDAKAAREQARAKLGSPRSRTTVAEWRDRWLADPLFDPPKEATSIYRRERTSGFAAKYGSLPLAQVGDQVVSDWLAGGKKDSTVPALRKMWNDAASAKAGRLVDNNPWANLGLSKGTGNRHKQPPAEEMVWSLIKHARALSGPHFAAWLQVAAFNGMRPAELDALQWDRVDFEQNRIRVAEQFSAATRKPDTPKNHQLRWAVLTPQAREALVALPRDHAHVFINLRGGHFTTSSRAYHWKAVRAAAGWTGSLYLATRHFAGWYMINILELPSEDVAIALGHTDGGDLVRKLYGHRDHDRALDRVAAAFENTGKVTPLRVVRKDTA